MSLGAHPRVHVWIVDEGLKVWVLNHLRSGYNSPVCSVTGRFWSIRAAYNDFTQEALHAISSDDDIGLDDFPRL